MKGDYRQGDIFFKKVSKLPESKTLKKDKIIAYGEVSGHSHRVENGNLWESGKDMFVESDGFAVIKHEEHGVGATEENGIWDGRLPVGIFEVVRQKEFTGPTTSARIVRD